MKEKPKSKRTLKLTLHYSGTAFVRLRSPFILSIHLLQELETTTQRRKMSESSYPCGVSVEMGMLLRCYKISPFM